MCNDARHLSRHVCSLASKSQEACALAAIAEADGAEETGCCRPDISICSPCRVGIGFSGDGGRLEADELPLCVQRSGEKIFISRGNPKAEARARYRSFNVARRNVTAASGHT